MTYYYFNKITGDIQWSSPAVGSGQSSLPTSQYKSDRGGHSPVPGPSEFNSNNASPPDSRIRADSTTSQNNLSSKRDSVYSDDSDIHPRDSDGLERPGRSAKKIENVYAQDRDITPAERAALLLQESLAPTDPDSIDRLADLTREAIIVVMASVDDNGLPKGPDHEKEVDQNVSSVVVAVTFL